MTRPAADPAALRRAELRGALAALAMAATIVALLGHAGTMVANQSLLANLRGHVVLAAAALWLAVAAAGWRRTGLACAATMAAALAGGVAQIRWSSIATVPGAVARLDLLSFNIRVGNRNGAAIADWLIAERPDVAVILEAGPLAPHLARLDGVFASRVGCDAEDCDLMILSRAPLTEAALLRTPEGARRLGFARIGANGSDLWLVATHWPKTLLSARGDHARQIGRELRRRLRRDPAPVVVAGDFNATHWDPNLRVMTHRLDLRHPASWRATWPSEAGPFGVPIDHVLISSGARIERFGVTPDAFGSNHRGLRAAIALAPPASAAAMRLASCAGGCVEHGSAARDGAPRTDRVAE